VEQHLTFERLIQYDPGQPGITLEVSLSLSEASVNVPAKVDTGASYCIFERRHGEALGISIESGLPQPISTVRGRFLTYGHEVTLSASRYDFDSIVYFAVDEDIDRNVLGRHGWLDRVVLGLIDYEGKLLLSRYSL
jgi:hypothetical protein